MVPAQIHLAAIHANVQKEWLVIHTLQTAAKTQMHHLQSLIIGLGAGSGVALILVVIGMGLIIRQVKAQRKKRLRQRFFKQNRGQLLQQLVCQSADIAERMIVMMEEVERATNNFDKARELGNGGHGTVYKGILSSQHVVAIKKSKIVIQKEIDEFINEVAILSQINHRNIVRLHGCCLETEVPLLIYEFISNGTLYNHLHVAASTSLSWKDRMRIAVETSRAIAYLHSLASMPVIHRDIKSPNILLDDNLTVKLSDFEGNLGSILDPQVAREGAGEVIDVALLAAICVKFINVDRPTMRQVEMTLESIHAAKDYDLVDSTDDESEDKAPSA
ncbi:hypothetical protein ACP4OV_023249 [Aristida adscensionis]